MSQHSIGKLRRESIRVVFDAAITICFKISREHCEIKLCSTRINNARNQIQLVCYSNGLQGLLSRKHNVENGVPSILLRWIDGLNDFFKWCFDMVNCFCKTITHLLNDLRESHSVAKVDTDWKSFDKEANHILEFWSVSIAGWSANDETGCTRIAVKQHCECRQLNHKGSCIVILAQA